MVGYGNTTDELHSLQWQKFDRLAVQKMISENTLVREILCMVA